MNDVPQTKKIQNSGLSGAFLKMGQSIFSRTGKSTLVNLTRQVSNELAVSKLTREEFVDTLVELLNRVAVVDKVGKTDADYEYVLSQMFAEWLVGLKGKYPNVFDLKTMSIAVKFDSQTNALIFKPSLAMNVLLTDMNVSL